MRSIRPLETGLTLFLALSSGAPTQQLVRDINPDQTPQGSSIGGALVSGGFVFFTADIGRGSELFVTSGSGGTREVLDIRPGRNNANIAFGVDLDGNGTILFAADDGVHGGELWRSDGTPAGTFMVADINPGVATSRPSDFWQLGGMTYFSANDGVRGFELWRTDGTATGTTLAYEFNPGPGDGIWSGATVTVIQNKAYLRASDGTTGMEPWVSDGTAAGTMALANIHPRDSWPSNFTEIQGTTLFAALNAAGDPEIWRTDGTQFGTTRVVDLTGEPRVSQARSLNGSMVFSTNSGVWICDGTATGTMRLFGPASFLSYPRILGELNGRIFFTGKLSPGPDSLWSTDGTVTGTTQVAAPAGGVTPYGGAAVLNNKLHFVADDGLSGPELWETDGTNAGTQITADIWPGPTGSAPVNQAMLLADWPLTGLIVLRAATPGSGLELWMSGGTATSTFLVDDLLPARGEGSYPYDLTPVGDNVYFTAITPNEGYELWTSDGTPAGTRLVVDLNPGPIGSGVRRLTEFEGSLYFGANDGTLDRLWVTDGSTTGTTPIANLRISTEITIFNDRMYFGARSSSTQGLELWSSDGTPAGTAQLADISPGPPGSEPTRLTVAGNQLFFRALGARVGYELHVTDGTAAGTRLVRDIRAGFGHGEVGSPTAYGDALFFTANDGSGIALWRSDGTAAGTSSLYDFSTVSFGRGAPSDMLVWNGLLYFRADDGQLGSELWQSDGTSAGTRVAVDIVPGLGGSEATPRFATSDFVYLTAIPPGEATPQLWRSDGTPSGTVKLSNINASSESSIEHLTGLGPGPQVVFSATNVDGNTELWTSDGTPSGTRMLAELNAFGGSAPYGFALAGRTVFFSAVEQSTGAELWSMDVSAFGSSVAARYGTPCIGSSTIPTRLDAPLAARIGEASFSLAVSHALPNRAAAALIGSRRQSQPLGGSCELLVDGLFASIAGTTGPAGAVTWTIPIANDPTLVGFDFSCQGAVADPLGALGVVALTDGLRIVVGS